MEKLEVVRVDQGEVGKNIVGVKIVAKGEDGKEYELTFLARAHYLDSIRKTFSRLNPAKFSTVDPNKQEEGL
jgi:hypothetical protein